MTTLDVDFSDDLPPAAKKEVSVNVGQAIRRTERRAEPVDVVAPRAAVRAVGGRELPSNVDAERHLLGAVFIDPADVLAKCRDANISTRSFDHPQNAAIFGAILALDAKRVPINEATVAEELKSAPEFRFGNVFAALVSVTEQTATTAQASYFIEKVRSAALLREVIRAATGIVERAYTNDTDDFADLALSSIREAVASHQPGRRHASRPLTTFNLVREGDRSILLGNRYLSRGDGAVLSSTSGMGKSSMSVQMAVLWALGRPAFGIPPNGALRSLIVQSEDSDGDVAEIWVSIAHVLKLDADQLAQVKDRVLIVNDRTNRGGKFVSALRRLIQDHRPDLVWVNPLQAFMDGDVTDSRDLGAFLREGLNGLNDPPSFGYVIIHHTTKPASPKDRAERLWHEVMYDMAGGAEIINWARAILSLRAAKAEGDFNLVLAKRGRRAGATRKKEQGAGFVLEPVTTIPLKHAQGFMPVTGAKDLPIIFWEEREPDTAAADEPKEKGGRPTKYHFDDYRNLIPERSSPGMELAPLHKLLHTNLPIQKDALFHALGRWAEEGMVQIIEPAGKPRRYRRAM
jgi:hypothetical protein